MEACVAAVLEAEGRIDVLVNNAGYGSFGAIENVSIEEARRQLEVNVFGLARLTQLVLPHMREQRSGTIINVSSIAGKIVLYFGGWYHVSKFAVEAFSDALRMEVKPPGRPHRTGRHQDGLGDYRGGPSAAPPAAAAPRCVTAPVSPPIPAFSSTHFFPPAGGTRSCAPAAARLVGIYNHRRDQCRSAGQ